MFYTFPSDVNDEINQSPFGHAVVIGDSAAGLTAARVLADELRSFIRLTRSGGTK